MTAQDFALIAQIKLLTGVGFVNRSRNMLTACLMELSDTLDMNDIKLAISELSQNIYKHGYEMAENAPVLFNVSSNAQYVKLEAIDQSHVILSLPIMAPPTDSLQSGGRGLALIEQLSEQYTYERRSNSGACHTLWFRRKSCK